MPVEKRGRAWGVRLQINGQKIRQSLGPGSTKQDAKEFEARIIRDAVSGKLGKAPDRTIDEAILRWLEGEATTHKDRQGDRARARAWRLYGGEPLRNAVAAASRASDAWLAAGLSAATVNRRVALLRRICRLAHSKWGWLDDDISRKLVALPGEQERRVFLTRKQVMALVHEADRDLGDAILLAAYTGLRKSELLRLTKRDVKDGCVIVRGGTDGSDRLKTKASERVVPVPAAAKPVLRRLPIKLEYHAMDKAFRVVREAAGLSNIRWHDLRHTYGSWLAQSGAPSIAIKDAMGHSTLQVTSRYVHGAPEHVRAAVRKLK